MNKDIRPQLLRNAESKLVNIGDDGSGSAP